MGAQEIRFFQKIGFLRTIWVPQNLVKLPIFKPSTKSVTISIIFLKRFVCQQKIRIGTYDLRIAAIALSLKAIGITSNDNNSKDTM